MIHGLDGTQRPRLLRQDFQQLLHFGGAWAMLGTPQEEQFLVLNAWNIAFFGTETILHNPGPIHEPWSKLLIRTSHYNPHITPFNKGC